jgi:hypothetical protein
LEDISMAAAVGGSSSHVNALANYEECKVLTAFMTDRELELLHRHLFTASRFAARYVADHSHEFFKALTVQFCLWTTDVNMLAAVFDPNANSKTRQERMLSAALRYDGLRAESMPGDIFHISQFRASKAIAEACKYAMVRVKYDPFGHTVERRNDPYLGQYRCIRGKPAGATASSTEASSQKPVAATADGECDSEEPAEEQHEKFSSLMGPAK